MDAAISGDSSSSHWQIVSGQKVSYSLPIGQFCTFRDYIFLCYISIDHVIFFFLNFFNKKIKMHNLLI